MKQIDLDPAIYESYDPAVPVWLSSDASRAWWADARGGYNPDFARYIDRMLEE